MNIPDRVKIGGRTYDIALVEQVDRREPDTVGQILYKEQKINLEKGNHKEYTEQVFWHELVHGIDLQSDSGLTEEQVRSFSLGLYEFLKANCMVKFPWFPELVGENDTAED